jgi:peptide/nickel transport system ATP-binding protein
MTEADLAMNKSRTGSAAVLEVRNLSIDFALRSGTLRAVDDVTFDVAERDIFALVGESGCGKSTLAGALMRLIPDPGRIVGGDVLLRGESVTGMDKDTLRRTRAARVAMVLQAAMGSFNPVITLRRQVEHVLDSHPEVWPSKREGLAYFDFLLEMVHLPAERVRGSFESQLSGGMRQRVAIAFGLLLKPDVIVLDEPTTALDVINQGIVIEVLKRLQAELGVTIVFVTHDLAVVAELANRVGVMYAGRLAQVGDIDDVFYGQRRHPYVQALLSSIPNVLQPGRSARPIPGVVPRLDKLPPGCRFAPRCTHAEAICRTADPALLDNGAGNSVACHPLNRLLEVDRP